MNDNLKDVILQTLEELENENDIETNDTITNTNTHTDKQFLLKLRERILVLFEGLQSPNINNLEKKLDLTINYLEYILSDIEQKLND